MPRLEMRNLSPQAKRKLDEVRPIRSIKNAAHNRFFMLSSAVLLGLRAPEYTMRFHDGRPITAVRFCGSHLEIASRLGSCPICDPPSEAQRQATVPSNQDWKALQSKLFCALIRTVIASFHPLSSSFLLLKHLLYE